MTKPYWQLDRPPDPPKPRGPRVQFVNLTAMAPTQKRLVWQNVQQNNPDLAALLKEPNIQALKEAFNAQILVKLDDINDNHRSQQPAPGD